MNSAAIVVNVKIVGHELKEVREKSQVKGVPGDVYDMLHVKMQGLGDDKKTRVVLVVDPGMRSRFPLGDKGEIGFEIRQTRMDLAVAGAN